MHVCNKKKAAELLHPAVMADLIQQRLTEKPILKKRKSHSREEKLKVVKFYRENGNNMYKTCKHFVLNSKTVKHWIIQEDEIKRSKKASKRVKFTKRARYPEMEELLYKEYKDLRKKGLKVNGTSYS